MEQKLTISDRLLNLRHKLGLSQQKLADHLGVTRNWITILEGDANREPSKALLLRLRDLEEEVERGGFLGGDPRRLMKAARERKGMTLKDLAKATGYSVGVLQALEEANGRGSERQLEKIADVLGISIDDLMEGAEPKLIHEAGLTGTLGARPNIVAGPGVKNIRYVPLISFAQAGRMGSYEDAVYEYEGHVAYDSEDPRAFCVSIRGDSMQPVISEGDVILVYPSRQPRNGDMVLARLGDEEGGDVMCKMYSVKDAGRRVILTSYNPVHPPLEFESSAFRFVYPIAAVTKTFLSKKKL
jgi:transcriptional regulator with XRE-family HTH domain